MRARGGLAPSFRLCSSFWSRAPLLCRDCRGVRARAGGPPGGEHGGVEAHDDVCGVFTSAYVCCVGSVRPIILFVSLISSHSQHAHLDLRPHTKRRHVQAERVCRDGTCSTPRPARCPLLGDDEGDHAAHRASRGQEPTPSGSPLTPLRLPAHCGGVPSVGGCQRRACEAHQAAGAVESRRVLRIERRRGQRGRRAVS